MVVDWLEFALDVIGGTMAFLCLFEGVRRIGRQGMRRGPLLIAILGLVFFAAFAAFAAWRYIDVTDTLAQRFHKPAAAQTPADHARARASFIASGLLASYVERGAKKSFTPTQDDVRRREREVATHTLLNLTARASLLEAVLWGILAGLAALAGFLFSREKTPAAA
ncbi:MAG TPA: hypothetical protein VF943_12765 [Burkholderiales bacterium]